MLARTALFLDHTGELGGAELCLLDLAGHMKDHATVLLLEDGPFRARLQEQGSEVEVIAGTQRLNAIGRGDGPGSLAALPTLLSLARQVAQRARACQVIYANSQKAFVVAALAGLLARKPVIWHLHDILTREHFSGLNMAVVVALANRLASRVIANSAATAEAFVARGGARDKVCVVYNGFEPTKFESAEREAGARLRKDLGLPLDTALVGVFCRIAPWKGQHVLIEALAQLPGVHAVLVGEALFGEASYGVALQTTAARCGVADRVHFLGFRSDVAGLMAGVEVVAHTSTSPEPFGRVIVEAMLSGKAVVATNAGGVPEIIDDGDTGLLVRPGDVAQLVEALQSLLGAAERREAMGQRAREHARGAFSLSSMCAGVEAQLAPFCRGERPR